MFLQGQEKHEHQNNAIKYEREKRLPKASYATSGAALCRQLHTRAPLPLVVMRHESKKSNSP